MEIRLQSRQFARGIVLLGLLTVGISSEGMASADSLPFGDVPANHWGYSSIQWAYDHHIVGGYPDGTFKPDLISITI